MKKIILIIVVAISFLPSFLFSQDEDAVWVANPAPDRFTSRCFASDGNSVHIVLNTIMNYERKIIYIRSLDGGKNWENIVQLSSTTNDPFSPSISMSGSSIHVTWVEKKGSNIVMYKRSTDNGNTWEKEFKISGNPKIEMNITDHPFVASLGNNIHVAWTDYQDEHFEVYYSNSNDNGKTWSKSKRIADEKHSRKEIPAISLSGDNVYLLWKDERAGPFAPMFCYKKSNDRGNTWDTDKILINTEDARSMVTYSISSNGSNVYVAFNKDGKLFFISSSDNGTTWSQPKELTISNSRSKINNTVVGFSSISSINNNVSIVTSGYDEYGSRDHIFYYNSTDNGKSWTEGTELTDGNSNSRMPQVLSFDNYNYIIWNDLGHNPSPGMYFKRIAK